MSRDERGQSLILMLAVVAAVLAGALILGAFGQAYGARGRTQRVADLAAIAGVQSMAQDYARLFELGAQHLDRAAYLARARAAAVRGAARNGGSLSAGDVSFPDGSSFAPTQVRVRVRDEARVKVAQSRSAHSVTVAATATAELSPGSGGTGVAASGGGYHGPLAYRQGKPMRPDVALAFDRMARAAAAAGIRLIVVSGFRSDAEQAALFARHPDPRWVAPPGRSLHRLGTELDLGPSSAYGWLAANAGRFGFLKRYSWEPWHFGYTRSPGTASVGFGVRGGDGRATAAVQAFVPTLFAPTIASAAQRWGVSAQLLAAQLYAESNFNPFAPFVQHRAARA